MLLQLRFSFKQVTFVFLQMYFDPCSQMASCLTNIMGITAWAHKFINNKGLQKFGNCIFDTKSPTLKIVKTSFTDKCLLYWSQMFFDFYFVGFEKWSMQGSLQQLNFAVLETLGGSILNCFLRYVLISLSIKFLGCEFFSKYFLMLLTSL